MRITPNSDSDKCGLLNSLFNDPNKNYLYNIPENAYASTWNGTIQNLIDCKTSANWPSSESEPYFQINLFQLAIKPEKISVTRRNTCSYPAEAVLEGLYRSKWEEVCQTSITYKSSGEVVVRKCKSNRYYTAFRYRQTKNSYTCKYIELHSFDIFGEMNYFDLIRKCTNNHCLRRNSNYAFIIIIMVSR